MRKEKPGQPLQATALVHEAWIQLTGDKEVPWNSSNHFVKAASEAMRRILISKARRKQREKHSGHLERVPIESLEIATDADQAALERYLELENSLYVSDMLNVEQAVANDEFSRPLGLLLQHRREPSGRDLRGFEWRYYWQQTRGERLSAFLAHDGSTSDNSDRRRAVNRSQIFKIQLLNQGRQLLSYGNDRKIKLWNLAD